MILQRLHGVLHVIRLTASSIHYQQYFMDCNVHLRIQNSQYQCENFPPRLSLEVHRGFWFESVRRAVYLYKPLRRFEGCLTISIFALFD